MRNQIIAFTFLKYDYHPEICITAFNKFGFIVIATQNYYYKLTLWYSSACMYTIMDNGLVKYKLKWFLIYCQTSDVV